MTVFSGPVSLLGHSRLLRMYTFWEIHTIPLIKGQKTTASWFKSQMNSVVTYVLTEAGCWISLFFFSRNMASSLSLECSCSWVPNCKCWADRDQHLSIFPKISITLKYVRASYLTLDSVDGDGIHNIWLLYQLASQQCNAQWPTLTTTPCSFPLTT